MTIYRYRSSYKSALNDSYAGQDSATIENLKTGESVNLSGLQTVANSDDKNLAPNGFLDTLKEEQSMIGRLEPENSKKFYPGERLAVVGGETYAGGKTNLYGVAQPNSSSKPEGIFVHAMGLAASSKKPNRETSPVSAGCPVVPIDEYKKGSSFLRENNYKPGQYIPITIMLIDDM